MSVVAEKRAAVEAAKTEVRRAESARIAATKALVDAHQGLRDAYTELALAERDKS